VTARVTREEPDGDDDEEGGRDDLALRYLLGRRGRRRSWSGQRGRRRTWAAGAAGDGAGHPARAPTDLGGGAPRAKLTRTRAILDGYNTGLY
jgi:hypothetical protein